MTLSRALVARWRAADPAHEPAALRAGRLHTLDALGVGLAASTLDQGEAWRRYAQALNPGDALLLCRAAGAAPADAALVNGGLIHSLCMVAPCCCRPLWLQGSQRAHRGKPFWRPISRAGRR